MPDKIKFDWTRFSDIEKDLSKTEKTVIKEHFNIWIQGHSDIDYSTPEMQDRFNQFKAAWIMCQMFTDNC
jgi:hypothetical protein